MATAKLTKRTVEAAELPSGNGRDRERWLWDSELKGFGVKLTPGGRRVYVLKYRALGDRQTRKIAIGAHGQPWTVEQARAEARRLLGLVAAGEDPAATRAAAKRGPTVAELCDLWLAEGNATKRESTLREDRYRIAAHVVPLLGSRKVADVTRADVERFMADVANGRSAEPAKKRASGRAAGGRGVATRTMGMLGAIFAFAVARGLRPDNPAVGVKRFPDQKRERFLSPAEWARLGEAFTEAEAGGVNAFSVNALRLLAMSGCRKSEVLTLRWEWVDLDRACLRLPTSKTGAKVVPLGAPAVELLSGLVRIEGNPFCFPGAIPGRPLATVDKVWRAVRARAGLSDVRLHDLRHSFASVGAGGGSPLLVIAALLGHRHTATTARYAHLADDPVKAAADTIAGRIAAYMAPGEGGEVVPITGRR